MPPFFLLFASICTNFLKFCRQIPSVYTRVCCLSSWYPFGPANSHVLVVDAPFVAFIVVVVPSRYKLSPCWSFAIVGLDFTVLTLVPDPEVVRADKNALSPYQMIRQTADVQDQLGSQLGQMQDRMASLRTRAEMFPFSRPALASDIATNKERKSAVEKEVEEFHKQDKNVEKTHRGQNIKNDSGRMARIRRTNRKIRKKENIADV